MADQFGGIPLNSPKADQFGGQPLAIVGDGETMGSLQEKYWKATALGDKVAAADAFHRLNSEGMKVGPAPQYVFDAGRQRSADDMSPGQQLLAGAGGKTIQMARGAAQLGLTAVTHGMNTPYADSMRQDETDQRALDAPLNNTGWGFIGGIGAQAAPLAAGGIAARGTGALAAFLPRTFLGSVGQGAVLGAAQPLGNGEGAGTRLANTGIGALAGGGGYGVTNGLGAMARTVIGAPGKLTANGMQNSAGRVIQEAATDPARLTVEAQSLIPGVRRTLAEQTLDPGIAQLQRQFPVQLSEQQAANNAIRAAAIRSGFEGGTKESAAILRSGASDVAGRYLPDIRSATGAETMRVVKSLDRMAQAPIFRNFPETQGFLSTVRERLVHPVMPEARVKAARSILQEAAANNGRGSSASFEAITEARRIIIAGQRDGLAPEDLAKQLAKLGGLNAKGGTAVADAIRSLKTAERGKSDVASLYNARKYITGELMPKLSGQSLMAARSFLKGLDNEIVAVAPSFKQYLGEYSAQMGRANQAEIGATLINRGSTAVENAATGERTLTPAKFHSVTQDQNTLAQQATGFRRATAARAMTADQRGLIGLVRDDLSRLDTANNAGRAVDSNTAQNLGTRGAIGRLADVVGGMLPVPAAAQRVVAAGRNAYGDYVNQQVAHLLANPAEARAVLARLPPRDRVVIEQQIARFAAAGSNSVVFPALQK